MNIVKGLQTAVQKIRQPSLNDKTQANKPSNAAMNQAPMTQSPKPALPRKASHSVQSSLIMNNSSKENQQCSFTDLPRIVMTSPKKQSQQSNAMKNFLNSLNPIKEATRASSPSYHQPSSSQSNLGNQTPQLGVGTPKVDQNRKSTEFKPWLKPDFQMQGHGCILEPQKQPRQQQMISTIGTARVSPKKPITPNRRSQQSRSKLPAQANETFGPTQNDKSPPMNSLKPKNKTASRLSETADVKLKPQKSGKPPIIPNTSSSNVDSRHRHQRHKNKTVTQTVSSSITSQKRQLSRSSCSSSTNQHKLRLNKGSTSSSVIQMQTKQEKQIKNKYSRENEQQKLIEKDCNSSNKRHMISKNDADQTVNLSQQQVSPVNTRSHVPLPTKKATLQVQDLNPKTSNNNETQECCTPSTPPTPPLQQPPSNQTSVAPTTKAPPAPLPSNTTTNSRSLPRPSADSTAAAPSQPPPIAAPSVKKTTSHSISNQHQQHHHHHHVRQISHNTPLRASKLSGSVGGAGHQQYASSKQNNSSQQVASVAAASTVAGGNVNPQGAMGMQLPPPQHQTLQAKIIIHLLRTEYPLIEQVAKNDMQWRVTKSENPNQEFDVYWNDLGIDSDRLSSLKPYQKANHFPAMYQITRKTFLARNLKRVQKLYPLEFDFFPKTWVLPIELNDLRYYASEKASKPKSPPDQKLQSDLAQTNGTTGGTNGQVVSASTTDKKELIKSIGAEIAQNGFKRATAALAKSNDDRLVTAGQSSDDSQEGDDDDVKDGSEEGDDESADEIAGTTPAQKELGTNLKSAARTLNNTMSAANNFGRQGRSMHQREVRKVTPTNCRMNKQKSRFPMIVKPDCMSQGKGIFLTQDIDSIPRDETYVVQEYMQNPYLIDGLKFDLRLYVLVLSCEPLKIFLYQEGLVRFATHQFKPLDPNADKSQLNNLFMHLTNYAVNKENENFKMAKGMNDETSHKRTLKKVLERLKADGLDTEKVMGEIKDVIIKTLVTIQQELAHNYRTCQPADQENLMCFEILGFDIILDNTGKPLLLEVNQAPSFATDSPLDYEIKKGLFIDTFRLLGLSVEKKRAKIRRLHEEKKDRMMTKLTLKQKNILKRQVVAEFKKEQEAFEEANHGNLQKIYPLPIKEAAESNTLAQEDAKLSTSQKQLVQSQYQALVRQQERYSQLLNTIGNLEVEKAIRARNRQEDSRLRDEKQRETIKLRLKKSEKKRVETQLTHPRQPSQLNKKVLLNASDVSSGVVLIQPEETIEQAMRRSIMKPPGTLDTNQSYDSNLRQSVQDRMTENKSQIAQSKTKDLVVQNSNLTPSRPSQGMSQNFNLQRPSQQIMSTTNERHHVNLRDSTERAPFDQNKTQIRQLIEKQQKQISNGMHGTKTSTFNLVNYGMQALQQQNAQPLTGRSGINKKPMMISDVIKGPQQMSDSLKPKIKTLHSQTNSTSQSQNPMSSSKLKTSSGGDSDIKFNRPSGQKTTKQRERQQTNLLPNIAKNMIHVEKTSQGFMTTQPATTKHASNYASHGLAPKNTTTLKAANVAEYSRKRSSKNDNRKRFQGSSAEVGGIQSAAASTQKSFSFRATSPKSKPVNCSSAGSKKADAVTPLQPSSASMAAAAAVKGMMSTPKRQSVPSQPKQFAHASTTNTATSVRQTKAQPVPLAMKTQQMNLGVLNTQPVIIDSNCLNLNEGSQQQQANDNNGASGPTKNIPSLPNGGAGYQTQKFSRVQLQAIIDNLYQNEGKKIVDSSIL